MNNPPTTSAASMSLTLRIADLHADYHAASMEEAIAMANLGAVCYKSVKAGLYEQWSASMEGDESSKAEIWRTEGRQAVLESVRAKMVAAEETAARLVAAEGTIQQLRSSIDAEAARRVAEALEGHRKDFEIAKMKEIGALKEQIAMSEGKGGFIQMLTEAHTGMRGQIDYLQTEIAKYKEAASTKSSYALGKIGETELFEMLNTYVRPQFPYAELKDMSAVKHVGDFHLWIVGPNLKHIKILVDSKKYSSPVQNCEIEKLYSDVDADDEVDAGLMVSLDTAICTKAQFQITKTKKNKPCMFLSFEKLDDGIRQEVLCWAIRGLVSIASIQERGKRDAIVEEMEIFLKDLNTSVADLDVCIKAAKSVYDMLRDAKERMVSRIQSSRVTCGMEDMSAVISHAEVSVDVRCTGKKINGERCRSQRKADSDFCARHALDKK